MNKVSIKNVSYPEKASIPNTFDYTNEGHEGSLSNSVNFGFLNDTRKMKGFYHFSFFSRALFRNSFGYTGHAVYKQLSITLDGFSEPLSITVGFTIVSILQVPL